jgi:hypothetical protein
MGTKRKKAFSGHLALSNSQPRKKRQDQDLTRLDEPRKFGSSAVGLEIFHRISQICRSRLQTNGQLQLIAIDSKKELQEGRIRAQVIYSNRRQAEQVEAALQEWDLKQNQPDSDKQRFSLHQRAVKKFSAKPCEGHVLLVEVTNEFFAAHKKAVFLLRASGNLQVGKGGKVVNCC